MKIVIQECSGSEMKSFAQDLMFEVSRENIKPPKLLLPHAVKSVTDNVEFIQMFNRYGNRIACSQREEINTALRVQKMTLSHIRSISPRSV